MNKPACKKQDDQRSFVICECFADKKEIFICEYVIHDLFLFYPSFSKNNIDAVSLAGVTVPDIASRSTVPRLLNKPRRVLQPVVIRPHITQQGQGHNEGNSV